MIVLSTKTRVPEPLAPTSDLDVFLEKMVGLEQSHVASLGDLLNLSGNELITALAESIILDSRKHVALYTALKQYRQRETSEATNFIVEADFIEALQRHIEVESEMMREIEGLKSVDLTRLEKGFIDAILDDERKHHDTLIALTDLVTASCDRMSKFYIIADIISNPAGKGGPVGKR